MPCEYPSMIQSAIEEVVTKKAYLKIPGNVVWRYVARRFGGDATYIVAQSVHSYKRIRFRGSNTTIDPQAAPAWDRDTREYAFRRVQEIRVRSCTTPFGLHCWKVSKSTSCFICRSFKIIPFCRVQQSRVQQSRVQQTAHVMRLWVFSLHQQRSHESDSIITCLPTMAEQLCTGDISCLPGNCGIYVRMQEEQAQRTARYARCRGRRKRRRRRRRRGRRLP